jgi:sodium transport system permease protein
MRKEFARFFYDRRMIIMVLLPAILIYVVYSFMGTAMQAAFAPDDDADLMVYVVNMPDSIAPMVAEEGIPVTNIEPNEADAIKDRITAQNAHVLMVFPVGFEALIQEYDVRMVGGLDIPNVEIYFNSVDTTSWSAHARLVRVLDIFEESLANFFDINRDIFNADLSTEQERTATFISQLLPMLLMIFLYSGCMGLALESITGEKERGTLATLLVSPLKRRELAIGKILSLAVLSFISGAVSAVATILALPNLMAVDDGMNVGIYSINDYILLAFIILTTLLLMVAMISIISAFAKTVKEATSYVSPLMIVIMLVSVTAMFGGGAADEAILYIIPIFNSVQSMAGIFALDYSVTNIVITGLSNLAYAAIGVVVLTKMFSNEKIMFSR